jgi:hypothetical protein
MEMKTKLSTLWIVVLFNMLFADIFSIIVETVEGGILDIPGDVKVIMAVAAIVTNIPILMIYFSRSLPYKSNRIANIAAGVFTIIYVVGGGSALLHYFIIGGIEVILLSIIVVNAWKWRANDNIL